MASITGKKARQASYADSIELLEKELVGPLGRLTMRGILNSDFCRHRKRLDAVVKAFEVNHRTFGIVACVQFN
jgi:hypothetical protein